MISILGRKDSNLHLTDSKPGILTVGRRPNSSLEVLGDFLDVLIEQSLGP